MLAALPLLAIAILIANGLAFLGDVAMTQVMFALPLPSGTALALTVGDGLVLLGLVLLYVELFKATRTSTSTILDHALSLAVFIVALVEFLIVPRFGQGTFLALTVMCLIDVIAGFTVTISAARRDFGPIREERAG
ncbi:hypothetical protein C7S18_05645 [Ahniella affigens]|uniref:Uncharacterized protein n=1 Tax=Ahniella affigens TaxID=2021234 RepID=A0A2P1PYV3_9GAMM|nr:hypothetical protein [Ahniella affigens]AVQ00011.1 hypothetical protein C7S18_05645 [Ahniella affigens]